MTSRFALLRTRALKWISAGGLLAGVAAVSAAEPPPLFEERRPDWEIKFQHANHSVLSVMPGESDKVFHDPFLKRNVKWEQDVYCPTVSVFDGKIYGVYRSWGEDQQWRMGLAWSDDGENFTRADQPVFHASPQDKFLGPLLDLKDTSMSYGDSRLFVGEDGTYYLFFNYFCRGYAAGQELAVATSRDMRNWKVHGRIFARHAATDRDVLPERPTRRFPHPAIVTALEGDRLVVRKIDGKYWMYLNVHAPNNGPNLFCIATSVDMLNWDLLRDDKGQLVQPMERRPGYFDSRYIDTTAAVIREDGILLIGNGINAEPDRAGDPRRKFGSHYPLQALFDRKVPHRLLARSESPFKGGDPELESKPVVFWYAPLYEAWSLVPWKGELLLYYNHNFGRRAVGLWKAPIPANMVSVK